MGHWAASFHRRLVSSPALDNSAVETGRLIRIQESHGGWYLRRQSRQLTGAADLVRKIESSVDEKIKALLAFAVENLALTNDGRASSRPNCMVVLKCEMVWLRWKVEWSRCVVSRS